MDQNESQLWILDYQPAHRLWLRALQEDGQAYTFEVAHRLDFELRHREAVFRGFVEEPRVRTVAVDSEASLADELFALVRVKEGDVYDYWRTQDDARAIRGSLVDDGHLAATVDTINRQDDGSRLVDVIYRVDAGPNIAIRWEGDPVGSDLERRVKQDWVPNFPPDLVAADLATDTEIDLRAGGHYEAEVSSTVATSDDGYVVATFAAELGQRGRKVELIFDGNEAVVDEDLEAALPSTRTPQFHRWLETSYERIEEAIQFRYAQDGYFGVTVGPPSREILPDSHDLRLRIPVDEGPRFTVARIDLEGVTSLDQATVMAPVRLAPGDPFSLDAYDGIRRAVREIYREEGYLEAVARTRVFRGEGSSLVVRIQVDEGQRSEIGELRISGNLKTTDGTIRRQLRWIREGEPLRASVLARAQTDLHRLGVFRSVAVTPAPLVPGVARRDLVVEVADRPDLLFDYGLRYRTDDVENLAGDIRGLRRQGFELALRIQYVDPFNIGDTASLAAFYSEHEERLRLGYQFPHFAGRYLPTLVTLDGERQRDLPIQDIEFDAEEIGLTVEQRKELSERLRLLYGFRIDESEISDITDVRLRQEIGIGDRVRRHRLLASFIGDFRDAPMNPRIGALTNFAVQWASPEIGSEVGFTRLFGQFAAYVPLGRGPRAPVWASSYRAGAIFASDQLADPKERFTAGGPFSVRGFESNAIGPQSELLNRAIGGRGVLIFNQEIRFPIWDALWGGVFFDTGNVFLEPGDIDPSDLRETAGLGLRYDIGFGV
ncbi:MAG: BamA/TamA family outer membrane protein, partial [Thermoanaerobaculia bacterium]|nr:BamA/TamA family outer membrane protein [Thermoanaerobaculia bacterium]